jgi:hypothetical protein
MDTRKKGFASQLESRLVHDGVRPLNAVQTEKRLALLKKTLGNINADRSREATRKLEKAG